MNLPKSFQLIQKTPIDELQSTLYEIEHTPTGAQILHIANDDTENVFCLSFQTLPSSSDGAPHILEHTVLCGSKKFPVKDPFFGMSRRSLNTYMNALTGADFTCYAAATENLKDFNNLLDVFQDAVFHPELKEMSFRQEGHRLEFEHPDDPTTELTYKGIVFNEMKGSLASPESRLWHLVLEHLMPDLPYAHNSGGDPKVIPNLTYKGLKEFHKTFYHPSRCLYYFYGNMPISDHLEFLEKNALAGAAQLSPLKPIEKQKRFGAPKSVKGTYPLSEDDLSQKTLLATSYLTCSVTDQEEVLALYLLDALLMDTDASPLKRALIESGLVLQADSLIDGEMSEVPFLIVCRGTEEGHAKAIETIINTTLTRLAHEGFEESLIEGALHQLEFHRLEIQGEYGPFGLTLFFRSGLAKQHGASPAAGLVTYSYFEKLREKVKNPKFLPSLIRKYLLDNPHRLTAILKPERELAEKEISEEKARLDAIKATLSSEESQKIVAGAKALKEFQDACEQESLDCLPKIGLGDVGKKAKEFPLNETTIDHLKLYHHPCFTNHITYAQLVFDLPKLQLDELPTLSLFTSILTELGCAGRSYADNLNLMQAHVGSLSASAALNTQYGDINSASPTFSLRSKALLRNTDKLFKLLRETVTAPRFDEKERIKELILQIYTGLQSKLQRNPLGYALLNVQSGFSKNATAKNHAYGYNYYRFIEKIAQNIDREIDPLIEQLIALKQKLFHLSHPHLIVSSDEETFKMICEQHAFGLSSLNPHPFTAWDGEIEIETTPSHARPISSPVAFTAYGIEALPAHHPEAPALSIASELMDNLVLHKLVREKGGAYGGGSQFHPMGGTFTFYGYRDPNLSKTIAAFEKAIEEIGSGAFKESDLEEAKLQIFQNLDSPVPPSARARSEYFARREKRTPAVRQAWRDTLLSLTKEQVSQVVATHLAPKFNRGVLSTFANEKLLSQDPLNLPCI